MNRTDTSGIYGLVGIKEPMKRCKTNRTDTQGTGEAIVCGCIRHILRSLLLSCLLTYLFMMPLIITAVYNPAGRLWLVGWVGILTTLLMCKKERE